MILLKVLNYKIKVGTATSGGKKKKKKKKIGTYFWIRILDFVSHFAPIC